MEQKKTLWIIAASGVFLLVVLGAALLLNSSPSNVPTTASITTIDKTPVVSAGAASVPSPDVAANAPDSSALALQDAEVAASGGANAAEAGSNAAALGAAQANAVQLDSANLTINTNTTNIELKTAAAPSGNITATSRAGEEALAKANGSNASAGYVAPAQGGKGEKAVAKAQENTPAKSAKSAEKKAAPAPVSTKYWVQAASFTSKKSADNARSELDENKIPAEVFTYKDKKDTLFYRVRVGPYTTKSEAEYWKGQIGSMDFFKGTQSYITEVKM